MKKGTFVDFSFKFGLAVAVALLCIAVPAKATLLDDFSGANCNTAVTSASPVGYTGSTDNNWVASAQTGSALNYDVLGSGGGPCVNVATITYVGHYIDMHGTTPLNNGADLLVLTSTLQFAPGTWTITFYWGNNGSCAGANCPLANTLLVTLGNAATQSLVSGTTTAQLVLETLTFTNSATGSLVFANTGNTGSDSGSLLGAVSYSQAGTGVPEPASALLLLPGLAAIAWRLRRRSA